MIDAHTVPGRADWIAISLGEQQRFLTVAEATQLRDALEAAINPKPAEQEPT